jgi:acetyltransferase-like isoleucine patch superfamily enzyme
MSEPLHARSSPTTAAASLGLSPLGLARLAAQSAWCTAALRLRGVRCGLVTCEYRQPQIYAHGTVILGRVALRGRLAPIELGANAGGHLSIGDRTFINQGASIIATSRIEIGDDVRIGDFVGIYDSDFHPVDETSVSRQAPVKIGNNVWLARGAIVLPGVEIGDHAVVAAGSVVTMSVPDRTLVAGNPAQIIRRLSASPEWRRP